VWLGIGADGKRPSRRESGESRSKRKYWDRRGARIANSGGKEPQRRSRSPGRPNISLQSEKRCHRHAGSPEFRGQFVAQPAQHAAEREEVKVIQAFCGGRKAGFGPPGKRSAAHARWTSHFNAHTGPENWTHRD